MVNPKFVYNFDTLGNRAAVATGNGSVFIINHMTGEINFILESVHSSAVSQVFVSSFSLFFERCLIIVAVGCAMEMTNPI